jgi:arylformamidase
MKKSAVLSTHSTDYYNAQLNARAMVPDHPYIFTRWKDDSARIRRTAAGLFDLPYGESQNERLDFFPASGSDAPLLVFIHGGWWRSLDKSDFSFIAPAFTHAGINVAFTNYTLAPAASLEEIALQQVRALAWLYRHAEQYDFDRNRIVVGGHSAGAHMTAMLMTAVWSAIGSDLPVDLIKGGFLLSGVFDLEPVRHADFVNVDLKLTPESAAALSPANMPQSHPTPFITAVGGLESDEFKRQNMLIGASWKDNLVADIPAPDRNHMTVCDALATPGHALNEAVRKLALDPRFPPCVAGTP